MANQQTREQRIDTLARTLRAGGLALSDAQAKIMAADMVGTEERVQKRYQEQHEKARSILDKYKGQEDTVHKPHPIENKDTLKAQIVEEMRTKALDKPEDHKEHTSVPFATKTVSQIMEEPPIEDEPEPALRQELPIPSVFVPPEKLEESAKPESAEALLEEVGKEEDIIGDVEELSGPVPDDIKEEKEEAFPSSQPYFDSGPEAQEQDIPEEKESQPEEYQEQKPEVEASEEKIAEEPVEEEEHVEEKEEEKEDPNQPERTRVYSDKIANPKPKEEYEENKVDLSAIFGVRK